MRLSELLTVVIGNVNVFEYYPERDGDPMEMLYVGSCKEVPKELLKRDVMYVSDGVDICLVK